MRKLKYTTENMHDLAKSRGFVFLSEGYTGILQKHEWMCSKGHKWRATPNGIKTGNGCKRCAAAQLRTTIEDARIIAKKCGFELMSKEHKGMKKKHQWQCKEGHIWEATIQNIRRGNKCPTCSRLKAQRYNHITEKRVRLIFEQLTQQEFPSDWHTLGNGQQLDGYCKELNVAFEYQGPQHYYIDGYWNKDKKDLDYQQVRDNRKTKLCQCLKIVKIDVPYTVVKPIKRLHNFIENKLKICGIILEK